MTHIGAGERSARRILVIDAALLVVLVVAVQIALFIPERQGELPSWFVGIQLSAVACILLAGLVAPRVSDRSLRVFALVAVAAYWLTLLTFPAAVPATGIERIPWSLTASSAAVAVALVAGGRMLAWATVVAGVAAGLVCRALFGGLDLDGVVNDLQALLTSAVICVIGGHILSVGHRLDAAAASTAAAAARESAERGRLAARTRAAALVHDEVLATLALAASDLPVPRARLAAQARDAASAVARLTGEQAHGPTTLRRALADEARLHRASFVARDERTSIVSAVPTATAARDDALIGATRQALRNSIQHAPDATRSLVLIQADAETLVEIVDDGPGFDPSGIADDRLGIRESIVGRMSLLDGGSAEIESAPGRGTVVRLHCARPSVTQPAVPLEKAALRLGVAVIVIVYVITQMVCALLAAMAVPGSWPLQLTMLTTALVAVEILRGSPRRVPERVRTAIVVSLACGGLLAGVLSARLLYGVTYSYGGMWFAVAFAFLFVALAVQRRIAVALAGGAVIVAVLVVAGVLAGAPIGQIMQLTLRPVVSIVLAVAVILVVESMQRRIVALHRDMVASTERESWTLAARSELTGRVAELERTALPLLQRIGAGEQATDAHRREYARCEGELRDGLRAGSLARAPLIAAVASARERGVDVLLLDDSAGAVDDRLIEPILLWMATAIAAARVRAVGRLLPPGREAQASLTVDGRLIEFAPSSQPAVISFHGE